MINLEIKTSRLRPFHGTDIAGTNLEKFGAAIFEEVDRIFDELGVTDPALDIRIIDHTEKRGVSDGRFTGLIPNSRITVNIYRDGSIMDMMLSLRHELYHYWEWNNDIEFDDEAAEQFALE